MAIDDIDAHKKQTLLAQPGGELATDLPLPLAQVTGLGDASNGQVAAEVASDRQAIDSPEGLAVHQQDAFVAGLDTLQKRLHHHWQLLLVGDQFEQGPQARRPGGGKNHPLAGAAAEGLEHHLAVVGHEGGQLVDPAAHQRRGHQVTKAQGAQFLVVAAQGIGTVEDAHAPGAGQVKEMGGIEISLIHRRVLAHPDPAETIEGQELGLCGAEPGVGNLPLAALAGHGRQGEATHPAMGAVASRPEGVIGAGGKVGKGADPNLQAGPLGRLHQRHAGILAWPQSLDRVDHKELGPLTFAGGDHACRPSRPSSSPLRSRAYRSSQPPSPMLLINTWGTLVRPVARIAIWLRAS